MNFELHKSLEILERTPTVLKNLLLGLSDDWLMNNEGEGSWSPYDVIGHLIHGEKTDWLTRAKIIMSNASDKTFESFDRFAQMEKASSKSLAELLDEFEQLRAKNLQQLKAIHINEENLSKTGTHPDLGKVNLRELLSTWTVHDLGHIAQISRVMAKQYKSEVGPWKAYLGILKS